MNSSPDSNFDSAGDFNEKMEFLPLSVTDASFANTERFAEAKKEEINGITSRGIITPFLLSEAEGYQIYGGRFVGTAKNEGLLIAFGKSRFFVQKCHDKKHGLMTHNPTVQHASKSILLARCFIDPLLSFFTHDVSITYVQSSTRFRLQIFVRPPPCMNLPADMIYWIKILLYGIPGDGLQWFFRAVS